MTTAIDFFCGAGGSSTGMEKAGAKVVMAVNHWNLAIETHNYNHPDTDHDCVDVRTVHPSIYPKTDIFWASPECTNHSLAKGKKRKALNQLDLWGESQVDPSEEKSRATMREVIEFASYHRNPIIIVENVVDIRYWQFYEDWLTEMINLGYDYRTLYLNSQFFGVPQSRDRWYTVFWLRGNKAPDLEFRPVAYCKHCEAQVNAVQSWKKPEYQWGRYGKTRQYIYRCPKCTKEVEPVLPPAASVIDWTLPAPRIGDREKPLSPKTIERIKAGLRKFGVQPFDINLAHGQADPNHMVFAASAPFPTQTTRQTLALVQPFLMSYYTRNDASSSLDTPIPVIPTEPRHSLVIPPFMLNYYNQETPVRPVDEPMYTVAGRNTPGLVVPPFILTDRNGNAPKSVSEPLDTVVGSTVHHSLITPPFVMKYYGSPVFAGIGEPIPAVTTVQGHALINPEELVDDCGFRMLEPKELKRGMSFPDAYVILGNKRDQVKQIGNAVCCNVARWITERCIESLQ